MYALLADIYNQLLRLYRRIFFSALGKSKNIRSSKASTHAVYGRTTRVGAGTVVTSDAIIGEHTYINRDSIVEFCSIGNYCSVSSGVRINPFEHNLANPSTSPLLGGSDTDLRSRVNIDHDVLISANAILLSGVHLATGSVVGAGAVVTKDTQPYEVVGGVPARHIGWRFDAAKRNALLESEFWNQAPEQAAFILKDLEEGDK